MARSSTGHKLIVELGSRESLDPLLCGSKAANLARLRRAGFPVPPGFVITTEARRTDPVPSAEIERAYRKISLDKTKSAVRSSATAEDLPGLSFAGQYDSFLNISSLDELMAAIGRCRNSLNSERAQAYLRRSGLAPESAEMAVVVQQMIPADVSGVIFTANPLNGLRCQLLVNAVRGTGEAMVSGKTQPVQVVIEKSGLATSAGQASLLSARMEKDLAKTAVRIERFFGGPQDVEFAFAGDRLHVLQARPATALPEPKLPYPVIWGNRTNRKILDRATIFWSNWNTRENMPYPLKPMSWSFLNDLLFPAIFRVMFGTRPGSPLYRHSFVIDLVNGRAYWNMNRLYGHPFFGAMLGPIIKHIDNEAGRLFNGLLRGGRLVPQKPRISSLRLAWEWLVALKTWAGFPWFTGIAAIEKKCQAYWRRADGYNSFPMEGLSNLELLRRAREFGYETAGVAFPLLMVAGKALWGMALVERLASRWKDLNLDLLLAGIPGNKTTEGALELFRLSEMPPEVREVFVRWPGKDFRVLEADLGAGTQGREYLGRVGSFLDRHGHRGLKDLDFGYPSWGEDRTYVYQMIKGYLAFGSGEKNPIQNYEESKQRRLALTAEIERRLSRNFLGSLKASLFRFGLKLAQDHFPLRENEKYYGLRCYPGSRRIVLEIGRRYAAAGLLEAAADIFFLTVPEVEEMELSTAESAKDVRDKVKERKLEWKAQIDARPPFVVRSDGLETEPAEEREAEPGVLRGVPASPGVVKGKARLIREPSEAYRFQKGEILVAPYTEPGWAPLFLLAKAMVMEVGGAVCHGAIVAREYGIPAVVGARGAMSSIKDGQIITVDGTSGEVRLDPEVSRIVLKGKRVVLRPPSLEDLPYIRSLWADPATMKDVGGVVLRTEEQMHAWFRRMVDPGSDTDSYFLIVPKNGAPAGEASFHRYDHRTKTAELNVKVQARHRGRGYGPESVRLLLGHFFGEFGGEAMEDPVASGNAGGQRMLERLGFRRGGTADGAVVLLMDKESFFASGKKREG